MTFKGSISILFSCVVVFMRVRALAVQSVNLVWDASTDTNVMGYVVYYGTTSRHYTNVIDVGSATSVTIPGLKEGANCFFSTTAYDRLGMESEFSNEVSYSVPNVPTATSAQPTIRVKGSGTISPDYSGKYLTIGKNYTVVAIPAAGQVFAGWAGCTNSSVARMTFSMARGLEMEASFIPSPFIPIAGSYNGLFYEDDEVRQGRAGFLSVSATSRGTYSGRLQLGASRYSFSGQLGITCQAVNVIPRGTSNSLTLRLRVGTGVQADQLFGSISDGTWTATLQGDRAVFNALTNPSPYAGNYTLVLPGQGGDSSLPAGDGFGSLRVTTAGKVSFSGVLADNGRLSQTVAISKNGQWPLFMSLYVGKGSALGWLNFANRTNDDINGAVSWIKPADATTLLYSGGFTNVLNAVGSTYVAPLGDTNSLVRFTNGLVRFCGGEIAADFTNGIALGLKDKVINLGSNKLSMSFSRSNGKFSGRVQDPFNGTSRAFKGVVLQKVNVGSGFLSATNECSRVVLSR